MLAIYLYREGERTQRLVLAKETIILGSSAGADVRLAGVGIAPEHCRLQRRAAGCFLVRDGGTVHVNGKLVDKAAPLYDTDRVFVGEYSFMIEWLARAPDATEEKLLAAIAAGDAATHLVYADWLEENGDLRRAELLRCQDALRALAGRDDPAFVEHSRRLRQLATVVDLEWRMRVASAPVEGCRAQVRFDFQCPKQWNELAETGTPEIRFCDLCREQVFYCATLLEARQHAWYGRCVAVDPANERRPDDLEPLAPTGRVTAERAPIVGMLAMPQPPDGES